MSQSLYFEPVLPPKDNSTCLPYELKHKWTEKYDLNSGPHTLKATDIPYLEGICDGLPEKDAKTVRKLIAALEKWGAAKIYLMS